MATFTNKRGSRGSPRGSGREYSPRNININHKHSSSPFRSTPFSATYNTPRSISSLNNDDLSVEELKSILIPKFEEEDVCLDAYKLAITKIVKFKIHKKAEDENILDISTLEKILQAEGFDFGGGDSQNPPQLSVKDDYISELEKNELKENINSLSATIESLTAQLKELKKKSKSLNKDYETKIEAIKAEFKKEMQTKEAEYKKEIQTKEAEYKKEIQNKETECKKEIEAQVQAVKASFDEKSNALTNEKIEVENRLHEQTQKNEEFSELVEILRDEMKLKEKQVLESIKEIIKKECECPICFGILNNIVTTTCGHTFCKICIDGWRNTQNAGGMCPVCRRNCTDGNIYFFNEVIGLLKKKFPAIDWTQNN